jgi:hypothetical protein
VSVRLDVKRIKEPLNSIPFIIPLPFSLARADLLALARLTNVCGGELF